jgi:hypothetical protein
VEIGDVGDEAAALVVYHGPDLVHVYSLPYLHHSSSSPKMRVRAREREREREKERRTHILIQELQELSLVSRPQFLADIHFCFTHTHTHTHTEREREREREMEPWTVVATFFAQLTLGL